MLLMGSCYWKINNENSDKDFVDYIMPSKEDLYECNLYSKNKINPEGDDYNVKDIRMLVKELTKGSLVSFQILYSEDEADNIDANYCLKYARGYRDDLLEELRPNLTRSVYGEFRGDVAKLTRLEKHNMTVDDNGVTEAKIRKTKGNIYKLYWILMLLLAKSNPFIEWFKTDTYINHCKDIRSGSVEYKTEDVLDIAKTVDEMNFPEKLPVEKTKYLRYVRAYVKTMIFTDL